MTLSFSLAAEMACLMRGGLTAVTVWATEVCRDGLSTGNVVSTGDESACLTPLL